MAKGPDKDPDKDTAGTAETPERVLSAHEELMRLWDEFVACDMDDEAAVAEAISKLKDKGAELGLDCDASVTETSLHCSVSLPGKAPLPPGTPIDVITQQAPEYPIDLQPVITDNGDVDDLKYCPNAPFHQTPSMALRRAEFSNIVQMALCTAENKRSNLDYFLGNLIDTTQPVYRVLKAALAAKGKEANSLKVDAYGYPLVELPHHPLAHMGLFPIHRLVMETYLLDNYPDHPAIIGYSDGVDGESDRVLSPVAIVRHKDGDRCNFALENLELLNKSVGDLDAILHSLFAKINRAMFAIAKVVEHLNNGGEISDEPGPVAPSGGTPTVH